MSKKKSGGGVDRMQIYVALIGVLGTIVVALITVYANRPAEPQPTTVPTVEFAATTTNTPEGFGTVAAVTETAVIAQNGGICLEEYFSNVDAANRYDLETGVSMRIDGKKDALYGVRFFDGGKLLGEIQFTGSSNSRSFKVISVIDPNCSPIFDFGNLDRPSANGAIGDWENLGVNLPAGNFRLRMGWYSGNQIELLLTSSE